MAEIKNINCSVTLGANGNSVVTKNIADLNLFKSVKIKKAVVPLKVISDNLPIDAVFDVTCKLDSLDCGLIDRLSGLTQGQEIKINITDELQQAIDSSANELIINFTDTNPDSPTTITFDTVDNANKQTSDIEYISKAEYSTNGTNHSVDLGTAGQASVNLSTGTLNIVHQDVQSDSNVLPLSISHVYNSFGTKLPNDASISNLYGEGWKLNLEQYLVEKTINIPLDNGEYKEQPTGEYEYFDENGRTQVIVEKYYYNTTNEDGSIKKNYIERTDSKLSMNLDGELQYNKGSDTVPDIVPIETELEAPSGLKLVTKKADIKGANLVDTEPDELLQLREQLKQYTLSKKSIDNNIKSNKEQLCYMALAKKAFVDQIAIQIDSISLNKSQIDYQIDNRKLLYAYAIQSIDGAQYVDWGRDFLANVNEDFNNEKVQDIIQRALGQGGDIPTVTVEKTNADGGTETSTESLTESDMAFVLRYFNDNKNLQATWSSANNVLKNWDKDSIENTNIDSCDMKTQLNMVNKNNNFYNTSIDKDNINVFLNNYLGDQVVDDLKLTETVSNLFNENNNNNSYTLTLGSKDILSLDIQMRSLIDSILLSQEQLEDYVKNIAKLNNQIHVYERQIPQFYLYSDNVIYGFSPIITEKLGDNSQSSGTETASANSAENETSEIEYVTIPHIYRLNYIADTYENSIVINYEKNTNKIENIIDSQDNVITFEYKTVKTDNNTEENHIIITDAQDKQITFVLQADRLAKVKYNDGTTSKYLYDINGKLVAAIGVNGIGAKFTYDGNNITEIQEITTLEKIENGEVTLKNTNFTTENLDDLKTDTPYIKIDCKDYNSTTISTLKNITTEDTQTKTETLKSLTYVFDNNGRVRTVYENIFDENNPNNSNPVVKSFDYVSDTKQISAEPLLNTENYMDDVCFEGNAVVQVPANYFGNGLLEGDEIYCGDDIYCETYSVHADFHSYTTADTDFNQFLTVSTTHLTEINNLITNATNPQTRFVLGGWAKADSAFVFNPDNDGDIADFPTYIQNRKFELRAEITYTDTTTATFKKCFDWLNTEWQYCAVPIEFDKTRTVAKINCFFDYSNNTITEDPAVYFTDFTLKEASYEERTYNNKLLTEAISSHSKWKQVCEYDDNDKLTKLYYYDTTNADAEPLVNEFYYNKNGKLFKTIDYKGIVTEKVFNENGIEIQTKKYHKNNPAEIMFTEQKLGEKGEVLADYNELGEEINKYEYVSGTGIVSIIADKHGNKTAYGYDTKNGTLLQMSSDVDGISNTNTYGYTLGFLTKVSHNDFDITYDYDSRGRISKIKVAGSDYLAFTYSEDGTNSITISTNSKNENFKTVTDKNGNVTQVLYAPDNVSTFTPLLENIYDTHGNLISVNDKINNTTTEYTLDKFGNTTLQTAEQHNLRVDTQNIFDADNNLIQTSSAVNKVEYETNEILNEDGTGTGNFETQEIITPVHDLVSYLYSYDNSKPESILNQISFSKRNPETDEQVVFASQSIKNDNLDRTHEIALTSGENKTTSLFHYLKNGNHTSNQVSSIWFGDNDKYLDNLKYKYDEKGNITEIYENSMLVAKYKYDSLSRLIREDNKLLNKTVTFEYDAGGNIVNRFEYTFTLSENLSEITPTVIPYSYATSGIRDKLMEYNSEQFEYDGIGNPTIYRNNALTWEKGRQLKSYGSIANYEYNAQGIRTSKTMTIPLKQVEGPNVSGTMTLDYFLDGNKIISQQDVANKIFFIYGVDGIAGFSIQYNNTEEIYYYKKNLQGDIIGLYNSAMGLIAKYEYDAWGNHIVKYLDSSGNFVD